MIYLVKLLTLYHRYNLSTWMIAMFLKMTIFTQMLVGVILNIMVLQIQLNIIYLLLTHVFHHLNLIPTQFDLVIQRICIIIFHFTSVYDTLYQCGKLLAHKDLSQIGLNMAFILNLSNLFNVSFNTKSNIHNLNWNIGAPNYVTIIYPLVLLLPFQDLRIINSLFLDHFLFPSLPGVFVQFQI